MTYDQNTGTGYIRISSKLEAIADSWPLDGHVDGIGVVLDLDSQRRVLGIELLGMPGHGPKDMVAAIASGAIAEASATEGFELPALGSNPDIIVQPSHRTTLVEAN
ncbi:hypothetical protein NCCP1664_17540 [Zafaria cholistanensis]|uniref:DUF2283 domain-containing protein n=1 Tax=Zafaria cholistanensis TaxID=1682741 RepID=A0A5A7NTX0_9MICC|nr:DUF2283 domain-containing protein [Zafaria cholistanensis]GER23258.1 hypothetical protein NCCP1664_17540 [Zafaria cholistanensis]